MGSFTNRSIALMAALCGLHGLSAATAAGTLLFSTGFEPSEGYPALNGASIVGHPAAPAPWFNWANEPLIATWNVIDGGQSARFWGTACSGLEFNTDPSITHVQLEGYVLPNFTPAGEGTVVFGLLTAQSALAWDIQVVMSETGALTLTSGSSTHTADGFTFQDGQYYHFMLDADYATGMAKVYVGTTTAGNPTTLTNMNLLTFDGNSEVQFTPGNTYAGKLGLSADAGIEGFFDNISVTNVTAVPEAAALSLLGFGGLALLRRR